MTRSPDTHLKSDIGPRPVLQVRELQVSVTVHKVDTEQFLTLGAAETWQALAYRPAALVDTVGPILALSPLTGAPGSRWDLTELSAERKRHRSERMGPNEAEGGSLSHCASQKFTNHP